MSSNLTHDEAIKEETVMLIHGVPNILRRTHYPFTRYLVGYYHDGGSHTAVNLETGIVVQLQRQHLVYGNFERLERTEVVSQ